MDISELESFADTLKVKFALPGMASPEDQLKPVVADLFKSAGTAYGLTVETRTETHLSEHKVRPDIAVYVGGLICGYIELKAPGLGADAPKLKGDHNKKQWEKLRGLPNLIYTDGREWALYRTGERPDGQPIVRLHDDPTAKGKAATVKDDAESLERLFRDFPRLATCRPAQSLGTCQKGGWVRFGDQVKGAAKLEEQGERAISKDFTEPARKTGAGVHLKNLYNDYVYFWRWALWRLFEQQNDRRSKYGIPSTSLIWLASSCPNSPIRIP